MDHNNPDRSLMKMVNIMILVVLLVVTGLLVSLHIKLNPSASPEGPPVAVPRPAVPSPPAANPIVPPTETPRPARTQPAPRRSVSTNAQRHYTQPETELSPAITNQPEQEATPPASASFEPSPVVLPPALPALPAPVDPEPQRVPQRVDVTIPAGSILTVRLIDTLHSDHNRPGDRFAAALDEAIFSNGTVLAPRGSTVEGRVVDARQAGRVSGLSEMAVELDRLLLSNGQMVPIVTDMVTRQGEQSRGADVTKIGAGAAIGAAIGAIAGGRRGAGIGAATGAGARTAEVLLTRGEPVILTPETRLSFQLRAPLTVQVDPAQTSRLAPEPPNDRFSGLQWDNERPPRLRRR